MITRLELTNFQAHSQLVLDVGRVTTIVGDSDRGKSAILRALVWLLTNKPSGDSFIKRGTDSTTVSATIDGHVVTRTKGKRDNVYTVDGEEFRAFGSSVPEPVEALARVAAESIARQMDPSFWVGLSGGQLADELNGTTGIRLASDVSKRNSSEEKEASRDIKAAQEQVDTLKGKIDKLDGVRWVADALDDLAIAEQSIDAEAWQVRRVSDALHFVESTAGYNTTASDLADQLDELGELVAECDAMQSALDLVQKTKRDLDQLRQDIEELTHELEQVKTCQTCNRPL